MKLILWLYGTTGNKKIKGLIRRLIIKHEGGLFYSDTINNDHY